MNKEYCKFCGNLHTATTYPKKCLSCGKETFVNPTPVAVVILPVIFPLGSVGLLAGKRGIAPHINEWALIGGYVDMTDASIEHAAARELREETNIDLPAEDFKIVSSYNNGTNMMIFCEHKNILPFGEVFDIFKLTNECSGIKTLLEPEELCFPSHTKAVADWFAQR